jgi:hypothetical protein
MALNGVGANLILKNKKPAALRLPVFYLAFAK